MHRAVDIERGVRIARRQQPAVFQPLEPKPAPGRHQYRAMPFPGRDGICHPGPEYALHTPSADVRLPRAVIVESSRNSSIGRAVEDDFIIATRFELQPAEQLQYADVRVFSV